MVLLDATVLIDFLNDVLPAVEFMGSMDPEDTALSSVTLAEVLVGCNPAEQERVLLLSQKFHFLDIDKEVVISAARLRREYGWKLPDAFQAALALRHKLTFVTRNTKDFNPAVHKFVKIPYRLR